MLIVTVCRVPDENVETYSAMMANLLASDKIASVHPPFVWALPIDGTVKLATFAQVRDLMGDDRFSLLVPEVAVDVLEGNFSGAEGHGSLTTADVPERGETT